MYQAIETPTGFAGSQSSRVMSSFAAHQPLQALTESYDNSQILRLCSSETRELAGRKSGSQTVLHKVQEALATGHGLSLVYPYVHITASGKGRLSVLALSLGGNSPPVYHA